jgi:hypothetical protein
MYVHDPERSQLSSLLEYIKIGHRFVYNTGREVFYVCDHRAYKISCSKTSILNLFTPDINYVTFLYRLPEFGSSPCICKAPSGYYFISSNGYRYKLTLTPVPLSEFTTLIIILS